MRLLQQSFGFVDLALLEVNRGPSSMRRNGILVGFEAERSHKRNFGVQFYIEDLTGASG